MALNVAQSDGRPNFLPGVIRAGLQRAGVTLGPVKRGPIGKCSHKHAWVQKECKHEHNRRKRSKTQVEVMNSPNLCFGNSFY